MRLSGVLAKLGLLERIRLSPEGFNLRDMTRLTEQLIGQGVTLFTLSFHSPSLAPGHTPYVRSVEDLREFLATVSMYLGFFSKLGGRFVSPLQVYEELAGEPVVVPMANAN